MQVGPFLPIIDVHETGEKVEISLDKLEAKYKGKGSHSHDVGISFQNKTKQIETALFLFPSSLTHVPTLSDQLILSHLTLSSPTLKWRSCSQETRGQSLRLLLLHTLFQSDFYSSESTIAVGLTSKLFNNCRYPGADLSVPLFSFLSPASSLFHARSLIH